MSSSRMSRKTVKPSVQAQPTYTPRPPLEPIVVPPTDGFKEAVFREIQALEHARVDAHRSPDYVLRIEFQQHLSAALNVLYKEGRIKVGLTINDKYITTKTDNDNGTEKETDTGC